MLRGPAGGPVSKEDAVFVQIARMCDKYLGAYKLEEVKEKKFFENPDFPKLEALPAEELQNLFYRLYHSFKEKPEGYAPEDSKRDAATLLLRRLTAVKLIIPKLLKSKTGLLIKREGEVLSLDKSRVWARRHDGEGVGYNIFTSLFIDGECLEKIHLALSQIYSKPRNCVVTDLLFDFENPKDLKLVLKDILSFSGDHGFTPLISACAKNSPKSVTAIFQAAEFAITDPKERKGFVKELFRQRNRDGFTPLISACANSPESVAAIFQAIASAITDPKERKEFVQELLRQKDNRDFTPLIDACAHNSPESIIAIFQAVESAITEPEDRKNFVKELLVQRDVYGSTPLISACAKNSPESIVAIFQAIASAITDPEEKKDFVKELLRDENQNRCTSLTNASNFHVKHRDLQKMEVERKRPRKDIEAVAAAESCAEMVTALVEGAGSLVKEPKFFVEIFDYGYGYKSNLGQFSDLLSAKERGNLESLKLRVTTSSLESSGGAAAAPSSGLKAGSASALNSGRKSFHDPYLRG